jgi:DNA-binding transcriptional ArsR family regulator
MARYRCVDREVGDDPDGGGDDHVYNNGGNPQIGQVKGAEADIGGQHQRIAVGEIELARRPQNEPHAAREQRVDDAKDEAADADREEELHRRAAHYSATVEVAIQCQLRFPASEESAVTGHRYCWPMVSTITRNEAERLASDLSVLAEPHRLLVLRHLRRGARSAGFLAEAVGMQSSLASHHLTVLLDAGLVKRHRKGHFLCYTANRVAVRELYRRLGKLAGTTGAVAAAGTSNSHDPC